MVSTGSPRGTVTAFVMVNGPALTNTGRSSILSIAMARDGGSISTAQPILSQITSTGPLGDLTLESTRGLTGNVTAPSIVGSNYANGPITGTIQTTGALSGQVVALGNIFGDINISGNLTGRIAANGRSTPFSTSRGILGNINVGGTIGTASSNAAIVSRGEIGDSRMGTGVDMTNEGAIYGILAAEGPVSVINAGSTTSAYIFSNVTEVSGNPNAAAIDAIFESQNGQPITTFDVKTPLDQANLERILSDLARLQVTKNKSGQNVLSD
jgi:hypothetical protein